MPFPDGHFDRVLAVSSLEFVPDVSAACREVARVLAPGGRFVVVTPGFSPVVDLGLRVLTGERAKADYADRREKLLPTLLSHFDATARRTFPPLLGRLVRLYTALELAPKGRPTG
jgi:ubiquinone/menaquinone biosynthesis C-methylase UbiE